MEKIVKRYDFKELIKRFKEYCDIKMKYNYEKWKNERDERYLNISFFVYYSKKINVPIVMEFTAELYKEFQKMRDYIFMME